MSDNTPPATATSIVPHHDPMRVITYDGMSYHVTALGDEVATIDPGTGEVCRKRPAISRVDFPAMRPDIAASILAHSLANCAGPSNHVDMARTLVSRARVHLDELAKRSDKLAAKGMVEK